MNDQILAEYEKREADLLLMLQYCSWLTVCVFTTGERILINQERGALFDARNNKSDTPKFQLEGELAMKVERTISEAKFLKFDPALLTKKYENL